jgi:hypothetical protein
VSGRLARMSHWYRNPRAICVRDLLSRTKQNIVLDHNVPVIERVRHNRLFLDMRHVPPVVSIFCNSQWSTHP